MTDYIDKAEVLRLIEEHKSVGYEVTNKTVAEFYLLAHDHIKEVIERVVFPADVAPVKHGKWLRNKDNVVVCSSCGNAGARMHFTLDALDWTVENVKAPYCSECGAKMEVYE